MKTKIISFINGPLPFWIAGLFILIGLFNCIVGMFFLPNTWQVATGTFQLLYGGEIISNRS